jgi:hypothetical protein
MGDSEVYYIADDSALLAPSIVVWIALLRFALYMVNVLRCKIEQLRIVLFSGFFHGVSLFIEDCHLRQFYRNWQEKSISSFVFLRYTK